MSEKPAAKKRLTRRQFLARVGLLAGGLVFGKSLWEAGSIEVTRHRVSLPGLEPGAKPLRIVQLSDLHRGALVSEDAIRRAVALANAEKPDVIALTGDFVSRDAAYIDSCADALRGLKVRLGTWGVLGNHDYWTHEPEKIARRLEQTGVRVLTNANSRLGSGVYLVGVDDHTTGRPDVARAFNGVPEASPVVAMTHDPLQFDSMAHRRCIVLSGHTHGGQINFPGRAWYLRRRYGYTAGWYRKGNASLYVNRGIGVVILPFRFFAPPEITVFDCLPEPRC